MAEVAAGGRASRVAAAVLVAGGLALGSSSIERHGPDQAVFCDLGKSRDGFDILCPRPVLNGGWPAPYLFDRPGISVEDKLSFVEDSFRGWPFVADVSFYLVGLLGIGSLAASIRRRPRTG